MGISCEYASRKQTLLMCEKTGRPCIHSYFCAMKGWYKHREGALTCKYRREEKNDERKNSKASQSDTV